MIRRTAFIVFVFAAIAGLVVTLWPVSGLRGVGDVEFQLLDGRKIALSALRGKPVLLAFWATNCKPCVEELPDLIKLYNDLHPKGFELIAVAMPYDPPLHVQTFVKNQRVPYPVALDAEGKAVRVFDGVPYVPMAFILDANGKIAYQQAGKLDIAKARRIIERELPVRK